MERFRLSDPEHPGSGSGSDPESTYRAGRDPNLLLPSDYEYFHQLDPPEGGWPGYDRPRSLSQLQRDLNHALDSLKRQVSVNDKLRAGQLKLEAQLERERRWRKLLLSFLAATWIGWITVDWWLIKVIAPVLVRGLGK
jgi:hypothetical protein